VSSVSVSLLSASFRFFCIQFFSTCLPFSGFCSRISLRPDGIPSDLFLPLIDTLLLIVSPLSGENMHDARRASGTVGSGVQWSLKCC